MSELRLRPTFGTAAALANVLVFATAAFAALRLGPAVEPAETLKLITAPGGGAMLLAAEAVRLAVAAAALVAVYEFDGKLHAAPRRLMRIATESGVVAAALLFVAGAISFRMLADPAPSGSEVTLRWLADTMALGSLPGFGAWAMLAGWAGAREGLLPRWAALLGAALAIAGAAAFVQPALAPAFAVLALVWWATVAWTLAVVPTLRQPRPDY
jgi:hypothetical protein